jgi:hypothetical protein
VLHGVEVADGVFVGWVGAGASVRVGMRVAVGVMDGVGVLVGVHHCARFHDLPRPQALGMDFPPFQGEWGDKKGGR